MTQKKAPSPRPPATTVTAGSWQSKLRCPGVICLLLALITAVIYWPVAGHEFVNYDDPDYVTSNSHVLGGLSWANVVWAFTTGHASNWHPLTWLSHMLDCQLFGPHAGPPHLVNLAWHIANTLLMFLVLRQMTGAHWPSALVAGLFAWHPLHVESVAWVSERKDVLSTFFFLLTLTAYTRYARRQGPRRWLDYGLVLVCFALGLLSKPMLVTLPFVLLLLDYWPLERVALAQLRRQPATALPLLWEKLPFFALSLASSIITFLVQRQGGAVSTVLTRQERLCNALVSYARYLGKMLWPADLSVLYPHPGHWPGWQVSASALLLAVVTVVAWRRADRQRYLLVGWCWFLGVLVPVIGLVQVGVQAMADRYSYVPLVGLFIALVWGAAELAKASRWPTPPLATLAALVLLVCAALTRQQLQIWHDSGALFAHAVAVTDRNYLAYNNLGFYLSAQGKGAEAMEQYRKSLEINPNYEDALNNLGYALAGQKRHAEAIPLYRAALQVKPDNVEVHNNLGNALSEVGQIQEAIEHYRFVLHAQPDHADAHNNLGIALAMQGKLAEAVPHFQAAIRAKPNYASAHSNLGNAYAVQHQLPEAIAEYSECLRLNPQDAQAHNNLANVLAEQGKLSEAVSHYTEALRLNPNNPEAHFNLGITLARLGQREQAAGHWREALRLNPDYAQARQQLEQLGKRAAGL